MSRRLFFLVGAAGASVILYLAIAGIGKGQRGPVDGWQVVKPRRSSPWIGKWTRIDRNGIHASLFAASRVFGVSYLWLHACNHSEGGHVATLRLRASLRTGAQPGWNTTGSYAFGPMQFMLSSKPAPLRWPFRWGTFGSYMYAAFADARRRGTPVPTRFRRPDSNLGQAVVAAYMFARGHSGQWTGAGC